MKWRPGYGDSNHFFLIRLQTCLIVELIIQNYYILYILYTWLVYLRDLYLVFLVFYFFSLHLTTVSYWELHSSFITFFLILRVVLTDTHLFSTFTHLSTTNMTFQAAYPTFILESHEVPSDL